MRSFAGGKSRPEIGGNGFAKAGLIVFHYEKVVALAPEDLFADIPLAKHRITGDDAPFKHETGQQFKRCLGFVRFPINPYLTEGATSRVIEQRQQVHRSFVGFQRPAERFSIHCHRLECVFAIRLTETMRYPDAERLLQMRRWQLYQQVAERALRRRLSGESQ